ncbi:hypothetical protein, partial [Vibrio splendidus]
EIEIEISGEFKGCWDKTKGRKKISWYSRGDYTTGAKDTFACCRSDMASHITSGIKLKRSSFSSLE